MFDTKGFATISYNTYNFLCSKLDDLKRKGWIEEWFAVLHKAEKDEKKAHYHVFMIPVGRHKKTEYRAEMLQFVGDDGLPLDKPLGCMLVENSVFGHWYLYSLHDEKYLLSRGEERVYHYTKDDVIFSDEDVFERMTYTVGLHYSEYLVKNKLDAAALFQQFESGKSVYDVMNEGFAPGSAVSSVERLYGVYGAHKRFQVAFEDVVEFRKELINKVLNDEITLERALNELNERHDLPGVLELMKHLKGFKS